MVVHEQTHLNTTPRGKQTSKHAKASSTAQDGSTTLEAWHPRSSEGATSDWVTQQASLQHQQQLLLQRQLQLKEQELQYQQMLLQHQQQQLFRQQALLAQRPQVQGLSTARTNPPPDGFFPNPPRSLGPPAMLPFGSFASSCMQAPPSPRQPGMAPGSLPTLFAPACTMFAPDVPGMPGPPPALSLPLSNGPTLLDAQVPMPGHYPPQTTSVPVPAMHAWMTGPPLAPPMQEAAPAVSPSNGLTFCLDLDALEGQQLQ